MSKDWTDDWPDELKPKKKTRGRKMSWNFRVVRREGEYAIHEAYNMDGKIYITENPVSVWGEDMDELKLTLDTMGEALDKPVINYDTREEI